MPYALRPDLRDRSSQKSHWGAVMAQVRVLNYTLSIASPYLIAKNDLCILGTVGPRDASRDTMLGLFRGIHQIMRSTMITGPAFSSVYYGVVVSHLDAGDVNLQTCYPHCSLDLVTRGSVGIGFGRYSGAG